MTGYNNFRAGAIQALAGELFDDVAFNHLNFYAFFFHKGYALLEVIISSLELEHHLPDCFRDPGSSDIRHHIELLGHREDHRFLDEVLRKGQFHPYFHHILLTGPARDSRHNGDLVSVLDESFLSIKKPYVLVVDIDVNEPADLVAL